MESGLAVEREVPIAVHFRGIQIGSFRADLIVESKVLIEIKCSAVLHPSAEPQLLNYLRSTDLEVGLLLHFGEKAHVKRLVYSNDRKLLR
jgi:GxxExxY protein